MCGRFVFPFGKREDGKAKNAVNCESWIISSRRIPRHAEHLQGAGLCGVSLRLLGVSKLKRGIYNCVRGKCGSAPGIEA